MNARIRGALVAALMLPVTAIPQVTYAQTSTQPAHDFARQVGPHRFVGAVGIPNPFLSGYLRSSTGVAGTLGMKVGFYNFDEPPLLLATKQVDIQYLIQEFEYQHRAGNNVAVRLALSGSGRLGTDTAALFTEGVSVIMGFAAGATVGLSERPGFKLSASLDLSANSLTAISPRAFVEDVLTNGLSDSTNSLSADYSNLRVTTGLRAAWGRSPTTGYILFGDVGIQEPYETQEDTGFWWQAGGALSLDMRERWRPDLGFVAGATFRASALRNEDLGDGGWATNLGIFYTGRPELTTGIQVLYTRLQQSAVDNKFSAIGLNLVLRYDFS